VTVKGALEQHFMKQPKPSAQEITSLADQLQVPIYTTTCSFSSTPSTCSTHTLFS